jgi:signal peptidase II
VHRSLYLFIAAFVIGLDRWTKHLVSRNIDLFHSISIIPGFFSLTHVRNRGAAFSILADSPSPLRTIFLIAFSAISVIILCWLIWKPGQLRTTTGVALALILGGAAGNLFDRIAYGEVVDFLLFYFRQWDWPAFNVADSAIVIGGLLLIFEALFPQKHTEPSAQELASK